ncbi:MAG: hypothetical protein Pg6A_13070 [Termitinemataceae bacterium]|nr:MAG: hypothetical protein Pg6A_13070 [Termitinemataceae bacterium]
MPIFSESEIIKTGHKPHGNIDKYHHYVNKFTDGKNKYFIRFTVTEAKAKKQGTGDNFIHSTAISDVAIYSANTAPNVSGSMPQAKGAKQVFADTKLQDFFNSVNPSDVSKVVDGNGEPRVVWHGTEAAFDIFGTSKSKAEQAAFYFTPHKEAVGMYSGLGKTGVVMPVFLNIKSPYIFENEADNHAIDEAKKARLIAEDCDGGIFTAKDGGSRLFDEITAFNPEQIKSATDNAGTFDDTNPSILYAPEEGADNAASQDNADNSDNKEMGEQDYKLFSARIDSIQPNDKKFYKIPITGVNDAEIKNMKSSGRDITGYIHDTTSDFVRHDMNSHSNEELEHGRKNVAVTKDDIKQIPDVIVNFDYTILGVKRRGEDRIIYAKYKDGATYLYFEEFLDGKKNKRLRSKSFFIRKERLGADKLLKILGNNKKNDISGAKIIAGSGSHPTGGTNTIISPTAATSAQPNDTFIIAQFRRKIKTRGREFGDFLRG